ncbi:MAG: hypothetical protein ACYTG1_00925 [Planctomycetota bacterium]|jgi:hypothetical protein
MAGCPAVESAPFEAFHASVAELQEGTDQAWAANVEVAKDRVFGRGSAPGEIRRSDILMTPGESSFEWLMPKAPLYLILERNQKAFAELSQSFVDYAALMLMVSGGEIASPDRFTELAGTLNANLRSAADTLGVEEGDREIAIISTAAAELFRQFIVSRQRSALVAALDAAQPDIERFADEGAATIELLALDLWDEYNRTNLAAGAADGDESEQIVDLIRRNERFIARLAMLESLQYAYGRLPEAHADLRRSLTEAEDPLTAIGRLYGEAKRLKRLADDLAKAP